ncbi:MAG TPA: FeoA family protein [bacterium]|jgi:Fe2+ transport system protein FeoA|nr:FeoA family protein [bacterium]HOZ22070.1 FeoA family protein [bacterium]
MNFRFLRCARKPEASCAARLSELHTGQHGRILEIRGGWHLRQSLNQVGIHIDDVFSVERGAHLGGPILIQINSAQIALGHGMGQKIIVCLDENR